MYSLLFLLILITPVLTDLVQVKLTVKRGVYAPDGFPRSLIVTSMKILRKDLNGIMYNDFVGNPDQPNRLSDTGYYFPSPNLYVMPSDRLEITVVNQLDQTISLHIHGLLQKNNSWNDGGYPITDCGIPPTKSHTYYYKIPWEPSKYDQIYWYHSHDPASIADGFVGSLTVRGIVFSEQILILQDWLHYPASELLLRLNGPIIQRVNDNKNDNRPTSPFSRLNLLRTNQMIRQTKHIQLGGSHSSNGYSNNLCQDSPSFCMANLGISYWNSSKEASITNSSLSMVYPFPHSSVLINGNGFSNCSETVREQECQQQRQMGIDCIPVNDQSYFGFCQQTAPNIIYSGKQSMYLSILNAGNNLPLRIWTLYGKILILNKDSVDMKEVSMVDAITLGIGQRMVIMITSDKDQILFASTNPAFMPGQTPNIWSAILINPTIGYSDNNDRIDWPPSPLPFTIDNTTDNVEYAFSISTNRISLPADDTRWLPHGSLSFNRQGYKLAMEFWYTQVGDQLHIHAPQQSLLPRWLVNNDSMFRSIDPEPRGHPNTILKEEQAQFKPVNWSLSYGKRYQIIMISLSGQQHPWHIHNHQAEIIYCKPIPDWFLTWIGQNNQTHEVDYWPFLINWFNSKVPINQAMPILSFTDTWMVPAYSIVVFRISANQLGPWLLHCHVDWHLSQGMSILLSVTDQEGRYSDKNVPDNYLEHCELSQPVSSSDGIIIPCMMIQILIIFWINYY